MFVYGDSWTEGTGTESEYVKPSDREELRIIRNQHSWGKVLADQLNCEIINNGVSGSDNKTIFNKICEDINNKVINSGDFVVIMWSSTLRDPVPFFPNNEWHIWSSHHFGNEELNNKFFYRTPNKNKNVTYNEFFLKYQKFFIENLFNQNYYNIINQNYIIFIQNLLDYFKINHLQCDAFDLMVQNLRDDDNVIENINQDRYWFFGKKTFRDFLINTNETYLWDTDTPFDVVGNKHPSYKGYKIIGNELYRFINENNIIEFNHTQIKTKMI